MSDEKYRIVEEVNALGESVFIPQVTTDDGERWAFIFERVTLGFVTARSSFDVPLEPHKFSTFERAKGIIEKYKEAVEVQRKHELRKQVVETKYHEV